MINVKFSSQASGHGRTELSTGQRLKAAMSSRERDLNIVTRLLRIRARTLAHKHDRLKPDLPELPADMRAKERETAEKLIQEILECHHSRLILSEQIVSEQLDSLPVDIEAPELKMKDFDMTSYAGRRQAQLFFEAKRPSPDTTPLHRRSPLREQPKHAEITITEDSDVILSPAHHRDSPATPATLRFDASTLGAPTTGSPRRTMKYHSLVDIVSPPHIEEERPVDTESPGSKLQQLDPLALTFPPVGGRKNQTFPEIDSHTSAEVVDQSHDPIIVDDRPSEQQHSSEESSEEEDDHSQESHESEYSHHSIPLAPASDVDETVDQIVQSHSDEEGLCGTETEAAIDENGYYTAQQPPSASKPPPTRRRASLSGTLSGGQRHISLSDTTDSSDLEIEMPIRTSQKEIVQTAPIPEQTISLSPIEERPPSYKPPSPPMQQNIIVDLPEELIRSVSDIKTFTEPVGLILQSVNNRVDEIDIRIDELTERPSPIVWPTYVLLLLVLVACAVILMKQFGVL